MKWLEENKGFGLEVMDLRIGGLIQRTETVAEILKQYLNGSIDKIYELEEPRLDYYCGRAQEEHIYAPLFNNWAGAYTANDI